MRICISFYQVWNPLKGGFQDSDVAVNPFRDGNAQAGSPISRIPRGHRAC
jgi:hypothetical protein